MPVWTQYILGIAGLLIAIGVIWTKAIRPAARLVTLAEEMLPMAKELAAAFKGTPHAFEVLDEIVVQFRTDSGSSLRDVVNRLEQGTLQLRQGAETVKELAEQDREHLQRLIILLDRLTIRVDDSAARGTRMELAADAVAKDLAESHKRADKSQGEPGAAADAAVLKEPPPK